MALVVTLAMYIYVDINSGPPRENERYAVYVRNTAPQITAFRSWASGVNVKTRSADSASWKPGKLISSQVNWTYYSYLLGLRVYM